MSTDPIVRTLEECCLNAWPGLRHQVLDGWLVRFGDDFTRRANSVNPLHPGTQDVERKLTRCEAAYAALGQACVVKITPLAEPSTLDALLERRGYRREGETIVQLLDPLAGAAADPACELGDPREDAWQAAFTRMDATPPQHHGPLRAILGQITPPHTAALLRADGGPVSCGRAVLEDDLVGLFDIATDPARRRQGHAQRLIAHLLDWGRRQGARRAYLQVEADNAPARRLYEQLGFREVYRYWYRVH
ncbi:MAG TPA: GNAT family N-acetyltransferase [bacterium]|nr:GNAT family N-acetyltransferase [bacterium]